MPHIVAIGECMVEMVPVGSDGLFKMGFAGDTMNTAWYLRGLLDTAHSVDFLSAIGTDAISDQMLGFLQGRGIGTDAVQRRADRTVGLYLIHLQDGERSFSYWRGHSAARTLARDKAALPAALERADYVYLSGITAAILPATDRSVLREALATLRARGRQIVFDPNLRPGLWPDMAEMRTEIMAMASVSDILLPSFEDECAWFGDTDLRDTAKRYAGAGARTVIVKNGPGRILAWEAGAVSWHEPVPVATVRDTTAAGDSFNAGYLAARIMGASLSDAIHAGAALSARVIQGRGALVDLSDR